MHAARIALFVGAALVCIAGGCRTRLYELEEIVEYDFAPPPDVAVPPDFAPPADLVTLPLPFVCRDIYTVDSNSHELLGFDARTATFTRVGPGPLRCPGALGNPETMSVARNDTAWVFYALTPANAAPGRKRQLFLVDLHTGACSATAFDGTPLDADDDFGSTFTASTPGSQTDTLYVSETGAQALSTVDPMAFRIVRVGPLSVASSELTGDSRGELFAFEPTVSGSTIYRIDRNSVAAQKLFDVPQIAVDQTQGFGYAFAFWGGQFWAFVYSGSGDTAVWSIDAATGVASLAKDHTGQHIVGAGVAACAPLGPVGLD